MKAKKCTFKCYLANQLVQRGSDFKASSSALPSVVVSIVIIAIVINTVIAAIVTIVVVASLLLEAEKERRDV